MTMEYIVNEDRSVLTGLPFFFAQACKVAMRLRYGVLSVDLPDGRRLTFRGDEEHDAHGVIIVRDYAFARRTILGGDIGFFESFADGQWDTPDLAECLYVFARNADHIQSAFTASFILEWVNAISHALNKNTKRGAQRNIMAHYDLGNGFYEKWLDRTMTYSSARYASADADLESAQLNKYRELANSISLKPDESVLEIGSGWGGFAEFAAKEVGANVTGVTISPSQLEYARERIFREGLNEKVQFRLQDYREVGETYDKIASIEMFEAVGREYWPTFFDKVSTALKPGGVAGLQIITVADRYFDDYTKSTDFIQRYVFPGGMLPSNSVLKTQVDNAGLVWRGAQEFGHDYARTLAEWRERFIAAWEDIRSQGFDERFRKLWQFYFAYCEAGFKAGTINVTQIATSKA
ncbi:MAG: cyclopropane-fatty-acyl-phospholipid synthase family protein [Pseudomonadota bacterium]